MTHDARLIQAWLDLQENWWAHEALELLCDSDAERAWSIITEIVERAATPGILQIVAAGPLEDLVRAHAPALLDRLERVAGQSARWREALGMVRVPLGDPVTTTRLLALGCQGAANLDRMPPGFMSHVREFVELLESDETLDPPKFLARCARLLSLVYAEGLLLPDVEPEGPDLEGASPPLPPVSHRLGPWDRYFGVFDPLELTEPTTSSLADDLSDIYGELAPPLRAFDAGRYGDAIWSWRFSLRGHAGDHLVSALRAIHRILQKEPVAT